ncbi:MAG: DUF2019 domain-containing protein [Terricaulis sp.]
MMDVEGLVKEFADCVVAQRKALKQADAAEANKYADKSLAAFDELRKFGDSGRDALAVLLFDQRPEVRVTTAAFLLRHKHAEAKAVLEREAKGPGIIAFEAEQALERWKEGVWSLDPA